MYPMQNVAGVFVLLALCGLLACVVAGLVWMEDTVPGLPKALLIIGLLLLFVSLLPT